MEQVPLEQRRPRDPPRVQEAGDRAAPVPAQPQPQPPLPRTRHRLRYLLLRRPRLLQVAQAPPCSSSHRRARRHRDPGGRVADGGAAAAPLRFDLLILLIPLVLAAGALPRTLDWSWAEQPDWPLAAAASEPACLPSFGRAAR